MIDGKPEKKMYYAHCMDIYATPQELRDLDLINRLGFLAIDPSSDANRRDFEQLQANLAPHSDYMSFFHALILDCQAFCFRALPGGAIPAGVQSELDYARKLRLPIIELPSYSQRQVLSISQTREYLHEAGQR